MDVCPNYKMFFTFIAEKVEMASPKMSPCFATILDQLVNFKNKIGILICFLTDVFLGRFQQKPNCYSHDNSDFWQLSILNFAWLNLCSIIFQKIWKIKQGFRNLSYFCQTIKSAAQIEQARKVLCAAKALRHLFSKSYKQD